MPVSTTTLLFRSPRRHSSLIWFSYTWETFLKWQNNQPIIPGETPHSHS